MKILHLLDIPWWSGLSAYAIDSIAAHREIGHEVFLACEKKSLPARVAQNLGIPKISIGNRKPWFALFNFARIAKAVKELKPDALIVHTGSTHWLALILAKENKIPVFRVRATAQPVKQNLFNKKIYSLAQGVIFASEKLRQDALQRMGKELKNKSFVLYPAVEIQDSTPYQAQDKIQYSIMGGRKIGMLARLDPVKGHFSFFKAMKIVQEKFAEAEIHLAGAEENLKWGKLLSEAKRIGLKNIFYHGFLPPEKVGEFLFSCSMGVIASTGSEEVSRALLEWFSAGKAVVATSVGCIPEILQDSKGGFLIPPSQPATMAEKISELLAQPELAKKMGKYNFEFCKSHFSKERFQSQWQEILQG